MTKSPAPLAKPRRQWRACASAPTCIGSRANSKGATSGDLQGVRVGDLAGNPQMYQDIPKLGIGGTAGPFRVAEGMQIVALCSKEGANGIPSRDAIQQQILIQKLDAAGRRYMRELRRAATIEIKP